MIETIWTNTRKRLLKTPRERKHLLIKSKCPIKSRCS